MEIRHTETMILCAYRIPVGQIVKEHQWPISSSRNEKFVGCIRKWISGKPEDVVIVIGNWFLVGGVGPSQVTIDCECKICQDRATECIAICCDKESRDRMACCCMRETLSLILHQIQNLSILTNKRNAHRSLARMWFIAFRMRGVMPSSVMHLR